MVVFLLLGVVWAAVLLPPLLQARREARPIASIMSFRSQLWSLQAATPTYGDAYASYGDLYGDEPVDGHLDSYVADRELYGDEVHDGAAVHAFDRSRRSAPADVVAPGVVGAVVRSADDGVPGGLAGASVVAAQRAYAYRRRRQVLATLVVAAGGTAAGAVTIGGAWLVAAVSTSVLLAVYLGLLVQRGHREAERLEKVRYLTPIRAPRPSVVVIGGAAR